MASIAPLRAATRQGCRSVVLGGVPTLLEGAEDDPYFRSIETQAAALDGLAAFIAHQVAAEGATVVDVGVNIGLSTILLARSVKRVIAFEPSPSNAAFLRRNLALNRIGNVEVHEAAVSSQPGTLRFHVAQFGAGSHVVTSGHVAAAVPTVDVPAVTLDQLNLPRIAFIKIDAEGHEPDVLAGARSLLMRDRPLIYTEVNLWCLSAFAGHSPGALVRRLWQAFEVGEPQADGNVVPLPEAYGFLHDLIAHKAGLADIVLRPRDTVQMPSLPELTWPDAALAAAGAEPSPAFAEPFNPPSQEPNGMTDEPAADATAIWDRRYEAGDHVGAKPVMEGDPVDYTQHPFLYQRAIAKPLTGSLDGYSVDDVARRFMVPAPARVLAIGSGMAFVEEFLVARGYAEHMIAYEMSRTAIEAAKQRVADKPYKDRLELRCGDVLHENLPTGAFDVVFVQAAIHHFDRIEEMFALMHRVLRPGGLLIYDEYIGPDHHMYEPELLAIMDRVDDCLAPQYRWDHLAKHRRQHVPYPNLEWMLQHDPSEGVHASRILPLTYEWFDVVHRADYGGSIMRPFFTGILPNFDWEDPKDQTIARLVILTEQLLTQNGVIPHYNTSVVARRRDVKRPALTEAQARKINYTGWQDPGPPAPPRPLAARLRTRVGRVLRAAGLR